MRQILQDLTSGQTRIENVPCPRPGRGQILIQTTRSLISAGTERMLVEFGKANLIDKARSQPDKVRQVLDKVRTDGVVSTLESVRHKLDQPLPLGYCNVGRVIEIGQGTEGFSVGGRVASNGRHAEMVCVPANLCASIPDGVDDDSAAFAVLSAIGLQGIRLVQPSLGEAVVVTGLGLIGLLTVKLLKSHGCRVLGIDLDPAKLALAAQAGAEVVNISAGEDPISRAAAFSRGRGVDAVIVTASTKSNEPVHQAALMCRKRGRIVLVGVTGLELSRADFYEKELTFQVSCSYGPGRYDPNYEERGQDYPIGFVRWTEQRNFEAVLDMMAGERLNVAPLISHRYAFGEVESAYRLLLSAEPQLGILLEYPEQHAPESSNLLSTTVHLAPLSPKAPDGRLRNPVCGVIGAGGYATKALLPALTDSGAELKVIASSTGLSASLAGRKFGFPEATTDVTALIEREDLDTIVIATRHDSHASLVCRALEAGKHVFVEKPLAMNESELAAVEAALSKAPGRLLMVGFNRRFSPHVVKAKQMLTAIHEPKAIIITVNAGAIPLDHWTQDRHTGGGRIIGEGCHFLDLARFLAGAAVVSVQTTWLGDDTATIALGFEDSSTAAIHYFANGNKAFAKERVEVFCAGKILQLDNFRAMKGYGWTGFSSMGRWRQDKGNTACVKAFIEAIRNGLSAPIPPSELFEITRATLQAANR